MTAGDIPATTGNADQGFEGFRFVGYNLYDALALWDLSLSDKPSDILYAIDRATIAQQLVQDGAHVLDAPCYPSQFGCDQAAAVHYDYDPAKAEQVTRLMREGSPVTDPDARRKAYGSAIHRITDQAFFLPLWS